MNELGNRIEQIVKSNGQDFYEFARKGKVHPSALSRVMSGKRHLSRKMATTLIEAYPELKDVIVEHLLTP